MTYRLIFFTFLFQLFCLIIFFSLHFLIFSHYLRRRRKKGLCFYLTLCEHNSNNLPVLFSGLKSSYRLFNLFSSLFVIYKKERKKLVENYLFLFIYEMLLMRFL